LAFLAFFLLAFVGGGGGVVVSGVVAAGGAVVVVLGVCAMAEAETRARAATASVIRSAIIERVS
jgi:hypothetical protein